MQYLLLASSRADTFQSWSPTQIAVTRNDGAPFFSPGPANALRRGCYRFVGSRPVLISWVVLVCLSTAMALAIQPRYDLGVATYTTLYALQLICLAFFWVRMVAEIIACGLLGGSHGFLRSVWNWVEVGANVFGLLQVIPPMFHIRWMRAFAAARPLRFFVFVPWWREQLVPLCRAFPRLLDVMITLGLCLLALGLTGVMGVGGELHQRCYITNTTGSSPYENLTLPFLLRNISAACGVGFSCPTVSAEVTVQCLAIAHAHRDRFFTYDNAGAALLLMFKVASMDMWFENLEDIMNVKGASAALYLVVVALVSLFLFVLLTSVVHGAYAPVDTWCAPSFTAKVGPAARQRQDCGVQTLPAWPKTRQHCSARPTHAHQRTHSMDDGREVEGDVRRQNPLSGDGGGQQAPLYASRIPAEGTLVAREFPRHVRDFERDLHVLGFRAALRALEATTTTGAGGAPLLPLMASLVDSLPFVILLMVLSVSSVMLLAVVSTSTPDSAARLLHAISASLAVFFIVPAVLRLMAFGLVRASVDVWNYADLLAAVSGVLELTAPSLFNYRVVGAVRVLRCVRVAKYLCPLYRYEYRLKGLLSLLLLTSATLTLYALLGMQLFAGTYDAGAAPAPIRNGDFNTAWTALLACFRAFTGDMWTRYMVAVSEGGTIATGSLFFLSLQLFSRMMLFAVGSSIIILGSRDSARDEDALCSNAFPPLLLLPPLKKDDTTAAGAAVDTRNGARDLSPSPDAGATADRWRRRRRPGRQAAELATEKRLRVRGDAFLFVGPMNPVRILLLRVLGSPFYTLISTLCVAIGVVALFFERRHLDADTERTLHLVNIVCLVVFVVEMVMKWLAYGVVTQGWSDGEDHYREARPRYMPAYFRYPLNWVDFAANGLALAAVAYPPLRVGRVIRTPRLFTTQERPNKSFVELVKVLRCTMRVAPLIFFLYVAFAVTAMQMFAGGLFRCSDAAVTTSADCFGDYNTTVMGYTGPTTSVRKRRWVRAGFHYDAFGPALLSVFAMTTLRGVVMDSLGTAQRTPHQIRFVVSRECIAHLTQLQRLLPPLPTAVSRLCHRILSAQPAHWPITVFDAVVQGVLVVVCGFVAATCAGESLWQKRMIVAVDCVAVALCGAEVLLGMLAYGVRYLTRASYAADVVLFALMVVGVASPSLRFVTVVIFVKLIKAASTGLALLPAKRHIRMLLSSGALALLVLHAYAVVGTLLLGDIAPDGVYLTEKRNFSTVIRSLLVLLDCSTFDQWHLVMNACFDGAACHSDASATCGHTYSAVIFFVSFIVIESLVVSQLMLASAVVVFTVPLFTDVIQPFVDVRRAWQRGVGAGEPTCDFDTLLTLLPRFPASLTDGITSETSSKADLMAFLSSLRLPLDEHLRLRYADVLRGFAYRKYKVDLDDDHACSPARDRRMYLTAGEYYGQLLVQRYCDEMSRLTHSTVGDARTLSTGPPAATPSSDGVGDHDVLRVHGDDTLVPKGALPIPSSNVFLYTFPGESNKDDVNVYLSISAQDSVITLIDSFGRAQREATPMITSGKTPERSRSD
ncbi:Ion transport family protein [Leishmania donovani]|uniref:Ion transport family protein n=1 Tax=Leishmania donovani TaxID=5661 RepID=A0A504Y0D4_LEIDO|nr:Ion transport family protein [Leishmania donovani]